MTENRRQILEMLAKGTITAAEAEDLLNAMDKAEPQEEATAEPSGGAQEVPEEEPAASKRDPRYLRIVVENENEDGGNGLVNIRVPLKLVRAGLTLGSFIPEGTLASINTSVGEKHANINLHELLRPENIDDLVEGISDIEVDVNEGREKVRIFCE